MFRRITLGLALAAGFVYVVPAIPAAATPEPVVHEVKMLDISPTEFKFEPAELTVNRGDVIRWVQTTATPHNVELKAGPSGSVPSVDSPMGPYLMTPGDTYEIVVDDSFEAGTTKYVCTPHELMGMVGSITVE